MMMAVVVEEGKESAAQTQHINQCRWKLHTQRKSTAKQPTALLLFPSFKCCFCRICWCVLLTVLLSSLLSSLLFFAYCTQCRAVLFLFVSYSWYFGFGAIGISVNVSTLATSNLDGVEQTLSFIPSSPFLRFLAGSNFVCPLSTVLSASPVCGHRTRFSLLLLLLSPSIVFFFFSLLPDRLDIPDMGCLRMSSVVLSRHHCCHFPAALTGTEALSHFRAVN